MYAFSSWTHAVLQCFWLLLHTCRVSLEILQQLPIHLRKVFLELKMSMDNNFRTETPVVFILIGNFIYWGFLTFRWRPPFWSWSSVCYRFLLWYQTTVLQMLQIRGSGGSGVLGHLGRSHFCSSILLVSLSCKVISSEIVNETEMQAICKASELTSIGMNRKVHTSQN